MLGRRFTVHTDVRGQVGTAVGIYEIHTDVKNDGTQEVRENEKIEASIDSRVGWSIRNQSFGSLGRHRIKYNG